MNMMAIFLVILTLGVLPPFAYGQSLREAQQQLSDLGYTPGPVDGTMGNKTHGALKAFQHDHGLPPSGTLDTATRNALNINASPTAQTPSQESPSIKGGSILASVLGTPTENEIITAIKNDIRANAFPEGPIGSSWRINVSIKDIRQSPDHMDTLYVYASTSMRSNVALIKHGFIDHFVLRKTTEDNWISETVFK